MHQRHPREERHNQHADNTTDELCDNVEYSVPILHLPELPKRQRDSGIEVGAGSFTEWRENQRDGSAAHRNARQHSPNEFARDKIEDWRIRMLKQNRKQPGRDHEEAELGCLAEIFWPMLA